MCPKRNPEVIASTLKLMAPLQASLAVCASSKEAAIFSSLTG
jgi:hypothetical protein